jgi:hypothetical protein
MKTDIDTLVKDICAAQPELAEDAVAARALVAELIEHQPMVPIDESFKLRLRTELVDQVKRRSAQKAGLPWWLIYTVPVGVTAVLLLMVYPDLVSSPSQVPMTDMAYPARDASLKMDEESARTWSADMEDGDIEAESNMVSTDFFTASFSSNRLFVEVAYLNLSQPGFIVVRGREGMVAISDPILPGEHTGLSISMAQRAIPGAAYTATLHYDTGDGLFVEGVDPVAYDQFGQPIQMQLVTP